MRSDSFVSLPNPNFNAIHQDGSDRVWKHMLRTSKAIGRSTVSALEAMHVYSTSQATEIRKSGKSLYRRGVLAAGLGATAIITAIIAPTTAEFLSPEQVCETITVTGTNGNNSITDAVRTAFPAASDSTISELRSEAVQQNGGSSVVDPNESFRVCAETYTFEPRIWIPGS